MRLDSALSFKNNVINLCRKASQKVHALARVVSCMRLDKRKCLILVTTFVMPQFNYCSLIWMFHRTKLNNRKNKIHERALSRNFNNNHPNFRKLLGKEFCDNHSQIYSHLLQKFIKLKS